MRRLGSDGVPLRAAGAKTKFGWGGAPSDASAEVSSERLTAVVEHNAGDLTAVLEAGVPLAKARAQFAEAGQMLALDPPAIDDGATLGGVIATGDSGPLRHRYGSARDLLLGVTVALSDGTLASSGGKVIKNVAGYDLAKLMCGSFGTLGLIVRAAVRLHPLPPRTATVVGHVADPAKLGAAVVDLSRRPLEADALDLSWHGGTGEVLVRFGGAAPEERTSDVEEALGHHGIDSTVVADDDARWDRQRAAQRSRSGVVVKVSGLASEIARIVRAADDVGGSVVGRAAIGLCWVRLEGEHGELAARVTGLRRALRPFACTVLDAPPGLGDEIETWADVDAPALGLMKRVKQRFDPRGVCAPGMFVGGI
jgi:glycolate oxidase FAD binding subunit